MKWKVYFGLLAAYVAGVFSCLYLIVTLADQPHAAQQFLIWIGAGSVIVPLTLQNMFDW